MTTGCGARYLMWRKGSHLGLRSTSDEVYLPERSVAFEEPPTITMHQIATILEISLDMTMKRTKDGKMSPVGSMSCAGGLFARHSVFVKLRVVCEKEVGFSLTAWSGRTWWY